MENDPNPPNSTMKAAVTLGYGGLEQLVYKDVPVPKPGPDDVLVKVGACGLNNTDIWFREGRYGSSDDPKARTGPSRTANAFPRIQGTDVVGRIVEVGAGVAASRIGERVIVNNTLYGEGYGVGYVGGVGSHRDGGYAEYCAVPADNAMEIDSPLSDAELATFPCAYSTAEHMLSRARVSGDDTVLITGASGGVGSALVQLAKLRGARVVALASARKLDLVRSLAPDAAVAYDEGDPVKAVRDAIGREDVDVALDVVGGRFFTPLMTLLRKRGRYVTAGAIDNPLVQLDLRTVYLKQLDLSGISLSRREDFAALLGYIRQGRIRPLLHKTFPLSEIHQAQTEFLAKSFFGKMVVIP